jgi:hypothetical protein
MRNERVILWVFLIVMALCIVFDPHDLGDFPKA